MAAELRQDANLQVETTARQKGEFTVVVDGHEVYRKSGDHLPSTDEVRRAVQSAATVTAGH